MLRGLRRTRLASLLSVVTLLCIVPLSVSSLFHDDTDDAICNPVLVVHDHAAHRFVANAGSGSHAPEHCFICHWHGLRSVQTVATFHAPPGPSSPVSAIDGDGRTPSTTTLQPARAPPLA